MALSGLDIYKLLPKTNCKKCGFSTCLAFAMALAQKKTTLDKCPYVSPEAKTALENASQPPIKLITIGAGDSRQVIGNETVMFRHEEKFRNPAIIGVLLEDDLSEEDLDAKVRDINALSFERVGQRIGVDMVCVKNSSGYRNKFINAVRKVDASSKANIALLTSDIESAAEALKILRERRPVLIPEKDAHLEGFAKLAKEYGVSIVVSAKDLDEAELLTDKVKRSGADEIILNITADSIPGKIQAYTYARRLALKKGFRPLGYPVICFTQSDDPRQEMAEAITYVTKYAGIVIVKVTSRELIFPLLVARQDIYQDPQKPVQVEPKIYEIGKVTPESPLIVTTNFSITYFTVAGEVEASKVPTRILCADAEGMSVLTAWAAEKFTADTINNLIQKMSLHSLVPGKTIVIPGYVAVMSGRLEELSGWRIVVGPREASGIPNFLRNLSSNG